MANPNPAGALTSAAGIRTTAVEQLRSAAGATLASSSSLAGSVLPPALDAGVFTGLVVAIAALAYWYRRIL